MQARKRTDEQTSKQVSRQAGGPGSIPHPARNETTSQVGAPQPAVSRPERKPVGWPCQIRGLVQPQVAERVGEKAGQHAPRRWRWRKTSPALAVPSMFARVCLPGAACLRPLYPARRTIVDRPHERSPSPAFGYTNNPGRAAYRCKKSTGRAPLMMLTADQDDGMVEDGQRIMQPADARSICSGRSLGKLAQIVDQWPTVTATAGFQACVCLHGLHRHSRGRCRSIGRPKRETTSEAWLFCTTVGPGPGPGSSPERPNQDWQMLCPAAEQGAARPAWRQDGCRLLSGYRLKEALVPPVIEPEIDSGQDAGSKLVLARCPPLGQRRSRQRIE